MPDDDTSGVYVDLQGLIKLKYRARGFSFLPRQPIHSLLTGRHASRMRGRGLNFEELRGYLPGDDVRTIDWKVTARTRKPFVRVFTDERDRPAIIVVDQRISMFFGTRVAMKSVVAAEIGAVGAWRVTGVGDRVGAVVFNDTHIDDVRPQRSESTVLRILGAIVAKNRLLRADSSVTPNPEMLNSVLKRVAQNAGHDYLIAVVSDFDGANEETTKLMTRLARHNDVLAIPVFDPSSSSLPASGKFVVSDGELQVELDLSSGSVRKKVADVADQRLARIMAWQSDIGVPVLPFSTDRDVLEQARELLGVRRVTVR